MHTFYADDTYLKTSKEDPLPKIHIFGGVLASHAAEQEIIKAIKKVKSEYTHENMPIKWNFRDSSIKNIYEKHDRLNEFTRMVAESRAWRLSIAETLKHIQFKIVVSCIEAYSDDKQKIKGAKDNLLTYLFENLLMRVGLEAKGISDTWQCVLDWPPDSNPKPFDSAYYRLHHNGLDSTGKEIYAGPLSLIGFSPSLYYTRCNHSPLLQLSDLIVGATKDHIEANLQNRSSCVGSEFVNTVISRFRERDGVIDGYGVVASSGNPQLKSTITKLFGRKA